MRDRGYFVAADGQSSQTACLAGTFNPHMGSSSSTACLPAEPGFYVPGRQIKPNCLFGRPTIQMGAPPVLTHVWMHSLVILFQHPANPARQHVLLVLTIQLQRHQTLHRRCRLDFLFLNRDKLTRLNVLGSSNKQFRGLMWLLKLDSMLTL